MVGEKVDACAKMRVCARKIGLNRINVGRWAVEAAKIGLFTQSLAEADAAGSGKIK